jgi:predicted ATPase
VVAFVGRAEPLARLTAAYQALSSPPGGRVSGWAGVVLVTGEAGIGKTTLLTQFASRVRADGGTVVWGTCWDGDQAPAWWPWTQALRALLDRNPELAQAAAPDLAAIVPELATISPVIDADSAARVRVFDAAGQSLSRAATNAPVVVILDDLHSADQSTVDLLSFMAHEPQLGALMLVGAYRPHESPRGVAATLADLASAAELVPLRGLAPDEMADLVQAVAGASAHDDWARLVYERSGGHPFYARELCQLLAVTGSATDVPEAVRDVIGRRLARLSDACAALLDAAAVAGGTLLLDVLAELTGNDANRIGALVAEATAAGILAPAGTP